MAEKYLTLGQAARELGVTKARVSQLGSAGTLKTAMVEGRKQVLADSVCAYAQQRPSCGRVAYARSGKALTLMSADHEVARLTYDFSRERPFSVVEVLDPVRMPLGTVTSGGNVKAREFNDWWLHRSIPDARPLYLAKRRELGLGEGEQVSMRGHGLSLSDCYWLLPDGADLEWSDISYFANPFTGCDEVDGSWLASVGLDSPDNTSEGELPKRWAIEGGARVLYKGSGSDDQRPCNEVVATRLFDRVLMPGSYVPYELERLGDGLACRCPDFLNGREEYIPAVYLRDSMGATRGSSTYDRLCRHAARLGANEGEVRLRLCEMMVCDSILANADRHWRNFGFIRNVDTLELRPAPIFDTGNCLWYAKTDGEVATCDWTFSARPFGPEPQRQLALVDRAEWFEPAFLDGFVEEAMAVLARSAFASTPERGPFIEEGLSRRVAAVSSVMEVLAFRQAWG